MYDFNFADLLTVGKRHWKLLAISAFVGLVLAGVYTVFLVPRQWTAKTTIVLGNQTSSASSLSSMLGGIAGGAIPGFMSGQGPSTDLYELLLRSWDTRQKVVESCDLQSVLKTKRRPEAVEALGQAARVDANPPTSVNLAVTLPGTPRGLFPPDDSDLAIRQLTVTCIQAYLGSLQDQLGVLRITSSKSQREFLEVQVPEARAKFYRAQEELAAWQARERLPSPAKVGDMLADQLVQVQKDLTTAEIQARGQRETAARARQLLRQEKEMVPSTETEVQNPQIAALNKALADLEQQLAEQQVFYHKTREHPDVQRLLVQKQELLAQIAAAYKNQMLTASTSVARNSVYDSMRAQLLTAEVAAAAASSQAQGLRAVLEEGKAKVAGLAGAGTEYTRLYENMQITQAIYETVVKQYEAARLSEKAEEPIFFVTDPAFVPYKKSAPRTSVSAIAGMLMGMLVGWGLAYRRERWRGKGKEAG